MSENFTRLEKLLGLLKQTGFIVNREVVTFPVIKPTATGKGQASIAGRINIRFENGGIGHIVAEVAPGYDYEAMRVVCRGLGVDDSVMISGE